MRRTLWKLKQESIIFNFVKLDGNVGCMVNGAGLAMATMDIINYREEPLQTSGCWRWSQC